MGGIRFDHISQVVSGKIFKVFPILLPYLPLTHILLNLIPDFDQCYQRVDNEFSDIQKTMTIKIATLNI